jgi:hypothetical protein
MTQARSLLRSGSQLNHTRSNQATTVTFATHGPHTICVQVREDGVQFDQIVLSPQTYRTSAPGSISNVTIVAKPSP